MNFQIKKSEKQNTKIKMALKGVSGSGKSIGALLLAKGLCDGDLSHAVVIDTENSIELYAHLGNFHVLSLKQPFSPEKYTQAITACEDAGFEIIIIDSISHCWHYLLQLHGSMQGNSFQNWNRITPLQNAFVQKILESNCHIICTMRSKQDYLIQNQNGKTTIEKVGLKAIQKESIEYEFFTVLDIDIHHKAKTVKDRTGLFTGKEPFTITETTGNQILSWCNNGIEIDNIKQEIQKTTNIVELTSLYNQYFYLYYLLSSDFEEQRNNLISNNLKSNNNGNDAKLAKYTN